MVARTVLDNFRVVGDNSDDIRAVFQVVLRLSQDVGESGDLRGSSNSGQFNYRPEPISKFDHVNQRRFFRKQPNHRVSKNCRQVVKTVASYQQPSEAKMFFFIKKDLKNVKVKRAKLEMERFSCPNHSMAVVVGVHFCLSLGHAEKVYISTFSEQSLCLDTKQTKADRDI